MLASILKQEQKEALKQAELKKMANKFMTTKQVSAKFLNSSKQLSQEDTDGTLQ